MVINKTSLAASKLIESDSWDTMSKTELRCILLKFRAMEEALRTIVDHDQDCYGFIESMQDIANPYLSYDRFRFRLSYDL